MGLGGLGSDGHQNASIEDVKCSNTKLKTMSNRGRKSKKTETSIIGFENMNEVWMLYKYILINFPFLICFLIAKGYD